MCNEIKIPAEYVIFMTKRNPDGSIELGLPAQIQLKIELCSERTMFKCIAQFGLEQMKCKSWAFQKCNIAEIFEFLYIFVVRSLNQSICARDFAYPVYCSKHWGNETWAWNGPGDDSSLFTPYRALVLYNYSDHEALDIREGDVLEIVKDFNDGWLLANRQTPPRLHGRVPENYVKAIPRPK